ncbi:triose-phosphate isomerase [bacterium]|nr:triose-phosphate isomerase [bacterium]
MTAAASRIPFLAGNWKMHKDRASAVQLARAIAEGVRDISGREVAIFPPYPFIEAVAHAVNGTPVEIGAQECRAEDSGAFTGDVSAPMIASVGATLCLVGHSERRQYHAETNEGCNRKILSLLSHGILPIYCVGETLAERDAIRTFDVLETQLVEGLARLSPAEVGRLVVAYEPVWAIGTGRVATPEQAQEAHAFIRTVVARIAGADISGRIRIQYGGSVKAENVDELMACEDVDGALVGGASLLAADFLRIVRFESRGS